MIANIAISAEHMDTDDKLVSYIQKKIGSLDKLLSRSERASARAAVVMTWQASDDHQDYTCRALITWGDKSCEVTERVSNAFSAVDIAEARLRQLLIS